MDRLKIHFELDLGKWNFQIGTLLQELQEEEPDEEIVHEIVSETQIGFSPNPPADED